MRRGRWRKPHPGVRNPIMPKYDDADFEVDPLGVFNGKGFASGSER